MTELSKLPAHMTTGIVKSKTVSAFTTDTTIYSANTLLVANLGTGYFSIKIADGVNTWINLPEALNNGNAVQNYSGIIPAGSDTITLPWSYDLLNPNILVFVGTLKQRLSTLTYVSANVVKIASAVPYDTEVEVLMIPKNLIPSLMSANYNYVIDGAFDFWYEGTSQTASGYGSATMWLFAHAGSTKTITRQAFTVGQVFPDGVPTPKYYARTVVSTILGANNCVATQHRMEDVTKLAGKTVTLSFYAKADTNRNITVELTQFFGTGGNPSAEVAGIGATKLTISTVWTKYTVTVTLPSVEGKTLGTNNNHGTIIFFWFDAGSGFDSRTNTLGQQSGTFDIALVKLEEGSIATPYVRDVGLERSRIYRYYVTVKVIWVGNTTAATTYNTSVNYTEMSAIPTVSNTQTSTANGLMGTRAAASITASNLSYGASATATQAASGYSDTLTLDARP